MEQRVYADTTKWTGMHRGVKRGKSFGGCMGKLDPKIADKLARRQSALMRFESASNASTRPPGITGRTVPGSQNRHKQG